MLEIWSFQQIVLGKLDIHVQKKEEEAGPFMCVVHNTIHKI